MLAVQQKKFFNCRLSRVYNYHWWLIRCRLKIISFCNITLEKKIWIGDFHLFLDTAWDKLETTLCQRTKEVSWMDRSGTKRRKVTKRYEKVFQFNREPNLARRKWVFEINLTTKGVRWTGSKIGIHFFHKLLENEFLPCFPQFQLSDFINQARKWLTSSPNISTSDAALRKFSTSQHKLMLEHDVTMSQKEI